MAKPGPGPGLRLILGSASPRRRDLLAQIGLVPHDIRPPDIDETPHARELPRAHVLRLALEKAQAVPAGPDEIVLCADTTVALGRRILGKPVDADEARIFLRALSGRRHRVFTAVAVRREDRLWKRVVETIVGMKRLSEGEIASYLSSGEWQGKAGGYAIQGMAGAFIPRINGSVSSVIGLPLAETAGLLTAAGFPVWRDG